jgi:hypothetical protein
MPMAARATLDGSGTSTAAKSLLWFTIAHTVRVLRSVPYTPMALAGVAPGLAAGNRPGTQLHSSDSIVTSEAFASELQ